MDAVAEFVCTHCGLTFAGERILYNHILSKHQPLTSTDQLLTEILEELRAIRLAWEGK